MVSESSKRKSKAGLNAEITGLSQGGSLFYFAYPMMHRIRIAGEGGRKPVIFAESLLKRGGFEYKIEINIQRGRIYG